MRTDIHHTSLALSRDGCLLFAACGVRSLAYGFLSVILGLYLDTIGLSTTVIGWSFTAALAGGAVMTILITSLADAFGRKPLLILGALLSWLFAVNSNPFAHAISPEKPRFWSIPVLLLSIRLTTADGIVTPVAPVASCV